MSDRHINAVPANAGYSGKPLWQKLGLKPGLRVRLLCAPDEYWSWCGVAPESVQLVSARARAFDFGHVFATRRTDLERDLPKLTQALDAQGMLWISWPKKSSGVVTDLNGNALREIALPLGIVDVKVCAVTEVWSGLKFVWRRTHRDKVAR